MWLCEECLDAHKRQHRLPHRAWLLWQFSCWRRRGDRVATMLTIQSLVYGLSYIYWWWKPENRKDVQRPQRMRTADLQEPNYLTHNFRKQKIFSSHPKRARSLALQTIDLFASLFYQTVGVKRLNSQFSTPMLAQVGKDVWSTLILPFNRVTHRSKWSLGTIGVFHKSEE